MLDRLASLITFHGRANRASFLLHSIGSIAMAVGLAFAGIMSIAADARTVVVILPLTALLFVFYLVAEAALIVRRLHDIGVSGWLFFVSFIPGANFLFLMAMLLIPGTKGHNQYGEPQGMTAQDFLRYGQWLEQRHQYEAAFQYFASVVENERFSQHDQDIAIGCIERLRDRLENQGILEFDGAM